MKGPKFFGLCKARSIYFLFQEIRVEAERWSTAFHNNRVRRTKLIPSSASRGHEYSYCVLCERNKMNDENTYHFAIEAYGTSCRAKLGFKVSVSEKSTIRKDEITRTHSTGQKGEHTTHIHFSVERFGDNTDHTQA